MAYAAFSWQSSFKTLFWDMFGMGSITDATVVVDNRCSNDTDQACYPVNKHQLTEAVGFILYGIYHLILVLMLLNMLIAIMSNTFYRIQVHTCCIYIHDIFFQTYNCMLFHYMHYLNINVQSNLSYQVTVIRG